MRRKYWGICSNRECNKWGEAPENFKENRHFLKCGACGSKMYLDMHDPTEAGYNDRNKVTVSIMGQS